MLIALDYHPNAQIELGELLTVVNVSAANVVKDIRENIRNLVGGRMAHYEVLVAQAVNGSLALAVQEAEAVLLKRLGSVTLAALSSDFHQRLAAHRTSQQPCHHHLEEHLHETR